MTTPDGHRHPYDAGDGNGNGPGPYGDAPGRSPYGDAPAGDDWAMSADPADDWILDPETGEYRMRLPGERLPAPAPVRAARPASTGAELELRSTREMEVVRLPAPASGSRAAARTGGRAADRGTRRAGGGRRRGADSGAGGNGKGNGGGFALVVVLGLIGVAGCGFGGYLLLHGGTTPRSCAAAAPAATPTRAAPTPTDGGPATGPGPSAAPIDVRVSIYDGSGQFGTAGTVLNWMQNKQGYLRTSNEGPVAARAATSLVYEPPHASQARTLAAALHLPPADLHGTGKGDGLRDPMVLTLGKDFRTPGVAPAPPAPATPAAGRTTCAPTA